MQRIANGIDRHVLPAAVAAGGAAGGVGAASGASAAAAAPEAAAGASRGLGGHADALKGGASDVVGAMKDPAGSAIRAGAGAVNRGIGALRSIPESADRFYEELAELDRFTGGGNWRSEEFRRAFAEATAKAKAEGKPAPHPDDVPYARISSPPLDSRYDRISEYLKRDAIKPSGPAAFDDHEGSQRHSIFDEIEAIERIETA